MSACGRNDAHFVSGFQLLCAVSPLTQTFDLGCDVAAPLALNEIGPGLANFVVFRNFYMSILSRGGRI